MREDRSGFIFLMALFVLTGLASVMAVGLTRTMTEQLAARRAVSNLQAFHFAEAGVDEALRQLTATPALSLPFDCPAVPGLAQTCRIEDQGNNLARVTSTGTAGGLTQRLEVVVELPQPSPFQWAAFADHWMILSGDAEGPAPVVDSYDSRLGPYGAFLGSPDPRYGSVNKSSGFASSWNADIRAEGGSEPDDRRIWIQNHTVYGDAIVGRGGDARNVLLWPSPSVLKGSIVSRPEDYIPQPVVTPPHSTPQPGSLSCNNLTPPDQRQQVYTVSQLRDNLARFITLSGSDCQVTITGDGILSLDWVNLSAHSTLILDGNITVIASLDVRNSALQVTPTGSVRLYTQGPVIHHAQINTLSQRPTNFTLYVPFGLWSLRDSTVFGAIYAPRSHVGIANTTATIYGSIIVNELNVDGLVSIHYDEALRQGSAQGASGGSVTIRSWRQL